MHVFSDGIRNQRKKMAHFSKSPSTVMLEQLYEMRKSMVQDKSGGQTLAKKKNGRDSTDKNTTTSSQTTLSESDLIQSVKLSSSATSELRLSCDLSEPVASDDDDFEEDDTADDVNRFSFLQTEEDSPRCANTIEQQEKYDMLYSQKQLSETDLILNAKLTDDGTQKTVISSEKLASGADEPRWNWLNLPGEEDGCKTPVNSDDGLPNAGAVPRSAPSPAQSDLLELTNDLSTDADFKHLITEVVVKLDDCYMEEILSIFKGLLADLTTPAQVLSRLQRFRLFSRDNLHLLQALIMRLDDTDLYLHAVRYIRHRHDTVYFYPELDTLPRGFGVIRCLVSGRDFTRLSREDLELVRFKVTSVLFLGAKDAYIVGIEPGPRVSVSLMLPERYVQEVAEMAREGLPELSLAGIEAVQVGCRTFETLGKDAMVSAVGHDHVKFLSVYQQLRDRTKRLEERDREVAELREEAQFMQLELGTLGAELEMLTQRALHESIGCNPPRRLARPDRHTKPRRHRTWSFPLPDRDGDRGYRGVTLQTAVSSLPFGDRVQYDRILPNLGKVHYKGKEIVPSKGNCSSDDKLCIENKDLENTTGVDSLAVFDPTVKKIAETNIIMSEIQGLIDELAFVQAFMKRD
ncbi:hypothetical protein MAR_001230 [Mya arenaria]|uniref:DED domain-containing protein n=1 Tax=Mya arenaria TaxID=6604 RepID=A0ABY7FEF7_MYAAR|nr:hypothetical protein MAR_001230 [Mya arenaria]